MLRIIGMETFHKPDRVVVDKEGVSIYYKDKMFHFEIDPRARFDGVLEYPELTYELDRPKV